MKQKALVWFTGLISQYNVDEEYNIRLLNVNKGTLNKISEKYEITFIIYVKDEEERRAYVDLLVRNNILDIPVIFAPYDMSFKELLINLNSKDYILIDYSKKRLNEAAYIFNRNDMVHVSQLLD